MSTLDQTRVFTALITPFNEKGEIDVSTADILVKRQEAAGNGIVLFGSTGEGLSLTFDEKLSLLKHVSEKGISVPILVGVGGFQMTEVLKWIEACEKLNIDGYLMVSPIYARPGPKGQVEWFRRLLEAASKPCMLYNVPARTGMPLAIHVLEELKNHENFWALKEASGSIETFCMYRDVAPNIKMFSGNDDLMPQLAIERACGIVSVMGNLWPAETRRYVELSIQGKMDEKHLLEPIQKVNHQNPVSIKKALYFVENIPSLAFRPPLSFEDGSSRQELLEADECVKLWMNEQFSFTADRREDGNL